MDENIIKDKLEQIEKLVDEIKEELKKGETEGENKEDE